MNDKVLHLELQLLLRLIDEGYNAKAWHGPNLRASLRRLAAKDAAWRPAVGRHNIWEIMIHAAYWKYVVRRRLRADKKGSFPLKGSNWFQRPERLTEEAWRQDLALLEQEHHRMREAIAALPPTELYQAPSGSKLSHIALIQGIAYHDVYHAGQIQLLKRLQAKRVVG